MRFEYVLVGVISFLVLSIVMIIFVPPIPTPPIPTSTGDELHDVILDPSLPTFKEGEIIIKFKKELAPSEIIEDPIEKYVKTNLPEVSALNKKFGVTSFKNIVPKPTNPEFAKKSIVLENIFLIKFDKRIDVNQAVSEFSSLPFVENAQPNFLYQLALLPNDPDFGFLWGLDNTGQVTPSSALNCVGRNVINHPGAGTLDSDIDAPEFWDVNTGNSNFVVAVIDSGIDYTHSDLAANMWQNLGEIANNGIDDDGNGYVDDFYGYDFSDSDSDPMDDSIGHGTHVAGTIGAVGNNAKGVTGVNWNVKMMALKIFPQTYTTTIVEAINYANMMGAKVSNNSYGGYYFDQRIKDAIWATNQYDHLFVAAVNNHALNTDVYFHSPSGYDLPNIISVASTNNDDNLSSFSNYGPTSVDLAAPGSDIFSTVVPNCGASVGSAGQSYFWLSGTSMATPHVAGSVALVWSQFPTESSMTIKNKILGSVDIIPSLQGKVLTGGRLDLFNTLDADLVSPSSITDLTVVQTTDIDATLTWTAPGDDGTTGTASSYDLRYSTSPITDNNFNSALAFTVPKPRPSGTIETFTVPGLDQSATYYFAIKAYDNAANESLSNIASGTTLADTTPPSNIDDLAIMEMGAFKATLTWTAPGDDGTTGTASSYDLRYSTSPITDNNFNSALAFTVPKPRPSGTIETFTVTNLDESTTYYFAIKSYDNAGNESLSNVVSGTTLQSLIVFSDDIENGNIGWLIARFEVDPTLWHISERRSTDPDHSPTHSWYYGREVEGNYNAPGRTSGGIISPMIDLTSHTDAQLSFNHFLETDWPTQSSPPYDVGYVDIIENNQVYRIRAFLTTDGIFQNEKIDISRFDDKVIKIRFSFQRDLESDDDFEGWYIDDVKVSVDYNLPSIATSSQTDATTIVLTYSKNVDVTTTNGEGFTLSTGSVLSNSDPDGLSNTITLTVSGINTGTAPDVTYTAAAGSVKDNSNNIAADQTINTTDYAPPTFVSATTLSPDRIGITLSEPIADNSANPEDFIISGFIANEPITVSNIAVLGSSIQLTLDGTLTGSDLIRVEYTQTSGTINDLSPQANPLANFDARSVTNTLSPSCDSGTANVSIDDGFIPNLVSIERGQKVCWYNFNNYAVSVTSGTLSDSEDIGVIFDYVLQSGQSYTVTLEDSGIYPYFDMLHPQYSGTIVVQSRIIQFDKESYILSESPIAIVRVTDPASNLNPDQRDTISVDVDSTSDAGGIDLTLTETINNSGIFEGSIFLTFTDESSGHRLRVSSGDQIIAEYKGEYDIALVQ